MIYTDIDIVSMFSQYLYFQFSNLNFTKYSPSHEENIFNHDEDLKNTRHQILIKNLELLNALFLCLLLPNAPVVLLYYTNNSFYGAWALIKDRYL